MTRDEINELFFEKRKKQISNKYLAEQLNCSNALISQFFNFKCSLSTVKEERLKQIIRQAKEYKWIKVEI
ncbi:hypothetical protein [Priestia koreensis]|nr:hypothetical protein [Priestia koreensis]